MKLLAIETSTDWCGVAFVDRGRAKAIVEERVPRKHAEKLPLFYECLKNDCGFNLDKLDGIAVSIGPGSFTGLRVGLSFAKGLAYAYRLSIIPISSLMVLVHYNGIQKNKGRVFLYSHRDFVYYQEYLSDSSGIKMIGKAKVAVWKEIQPTNKENEIHLQYGCEKLFYGQEKFAETRPSAASVGILAETYFDECVQKDPFLLVPNYISPFKIHSRS